MKLTARQRVLRWNARWNRLYGNTPSPNARLHYVGFMLGHVCDKGAPVEAQVRSLLIRFLESQH